MAKMTDSTPMPANIVEEITNLTRRMRKVFDALAKERGMTLARARILRILKKTDAGATQRALAEELEIEGPTLVRLLDSLESQGWIKRCAVAGDRRAKQIVLTEEGHRQEGEVDIVAQQFRKTILADIDPTDMDTAVKVITQMARNLDQQS